MLLNETWKAKGDIRRVELATRFLECEQVEYAAIIGMPVDIHYFENVWTLLLQKDHETYLEQVRFGENKTPRELNINLPKPEEEYDGQWSRQVRGKYGKRVVDDLHKLGAWEAMADPIQTEEHLDGLMAHIIAKRPGNPL
ncbi:MAG: hypothetical protein AAF483_31325 [Planctomycetota bacterium]